MISLSKASLYCTVDHVNGKHDSKELKHALGIIPGVLSVSVNDSTEKIAIDFDTTGVQSDQILKQLGKLGYQVVDSKLEDHIM